MLISLVTIIPIASSILLLYFYASSSLDKQEQKIFYLKNKVIELVLREPLKKNDLLEIVNRSNKLIKELDISELAIFDDDNKELFSTQLSVPRDDNKKMIKQSGNISIEKLIIGGYSYKSSQLENKDKKQVLYIIITSSLIILLFFVQSVLVRFLVSRILEPLYLILENLKTIYSSNFKPVTKFLTRNDEIGDLNRSYNEATDIVRKFESERNEKERLSIISTISSQVAHDIRSPLSALDSIAKDLSGLPEFKRILIRNSVNRIHDIANDLLIKNKVLLKGEDSSIAPDEVEPYLVSALIDSIVSEKRVQFRSHPGVFIESNLGENAYGLFASVNQREFKRAISNLVNNCCEAFPDMKGTVEVSVFSFNEKELVITVEDNGIGIPAEILSRLGVKGETHGKPGGSGLGLYHTKTTVESWAGKFDIESTPGVGTKVTLILPKANPPKTHVDKLQVGVNFKVAVLDDDQTIHNIWDGRISSLESHQITMIHFSDPLRFIEWHKDDYADIYLIDFEYIGSDYDGLKVIRELKLRGDSYLVTSRYEEENIIKECERIGIGLIPKGQSGFIPIELVGDTEKRKEVISEFPSEVQNVLIDDDDLIRLLWKTDAESKGIPLLVFSDKEKLFADLHLIHPDSSFYIDSNLGDDVNGEDLAKELFNKGFKNLIMATGYEKEHFEGISYIKDVIGKKAPWL